MGDLHANGIVFGEDRPCGSSPPSPPLPILNPDPSSVAADAWAAAEQTTGEILRSIQPTLAADRRRREVVDYVQRLIRYGARCEVFPYGSVPLKTYLPDGDIDLTALSCQNIEDGLVSDVRAVLHGEEINEAAEYEVKDVRFIDAEVKLVKCIVQDIVVDISFNQLGGLSTLCFLEKVDQLVAKDHLFKRSIILIKAWCYYESRVLGAHHGLISTYALETLVLYIFHQFHVSLDGPLAVLYRFLDYFSKFDWDNYCVSLKGPISKSSLPNIVAEVPENGGNTLLTEEFIRSCVESFSVPSRGSDLNLRAFPQKHLNIIDPLKENNNLGRSVNKGNFFRIRSAFKYGARKLGWILMLPDDRIADELIRFFANTLERHGSTQVNVDKSVLSSSTASKRDAGPGNQHNYESREEIQDDSSLAGEFLDSSGDGNAVASYKLSEDSRDFATSGVLDIASANDLSYCSNGRIESNISSSESALNTVIDEGIVSNSPRSHTDEKNMASYGSAVSTYANILENNFFHGDRSTTSVSGVTEASMSLLDLTGDYDSHIGNLQYGQMCNGYTVSPVVPSPPRSPKFPKNRNPWETVRQCVQINHSLRSQANSNCVIGQQVYVINHPTLPMTTFASEEKRKIRGTGAYFPNMTSRPYRDNRPIPGRGRPPSPRDDALQLYRAFKGLGCDTSAVINLLAHRDATQRAYIQQEYKTIYSEELSKRLASELSGKLESAVLLWLKDPAGRDASIIRKSLVEIRSLEGATEVICSRTPSQLQYLKQVYHSLFGVYLEHDIQANTSPGSDHQKLLLAYISTPRPEGPEVNREIAQKDAKVLYKAGEKKLGTDEKTFIHIFSERSAAHLAAVSAYYHDMYGHSLKKAIKNETSGLFELALLTIVQCAIHPGKYFAKVLHKAMKGLGTDDSTLIRVIVTRTEVDMQYIKAEYSKKHKKTLNDAVHSETSGHYRAFLLSLLGPNI